jgi:hypothetical protein
MCQWKRTITGWRPCVSVFLNYPFLPPGSVPGKISLGKLVLPKSLPEIVALCDEMGIESVDITVAQWLRTFHW